MVRLGELQVEAARQHRLATESEFFPKVGAALFNFHYNKFMGQQFTVQRPIEGGTVNEALPLVGKDQTFIAATAGEPITPLFKLRQAYNLARADENIARAKAGMPVTSTSSLVEKNYYELLVAERQMVIAQAKARNTEKKWLADSSGSAALGGRDPRLLEIAQELATADTRMKELTASLNEKLGWPQDTELELVPPRLTMEDISLQQATDQATSANPQVVEAQQNVVKARAASTLAKLEYVPDVVVLGGYAYNGNVIPALPRDFSFIGLAVSYTIFDFGKREHAIRERSAQVSMAETALELTKAKVAGSVKHSYFELERARQLSQLTRRMASSLEQNVSLESDGSEVAASRARVELEMYQADLDYLQALADLKALMGER
jgi:outer membrane protein TolC